MSELRIICTGVGRLRHETVERAVIMWVPSGLERDGFAVWGQEVPLRELDAQVLGDSARGAKSARPNKQMHRSPVDTQTRRDGGKTFVIPACPRCRHPAMLLRDDTLRSYMDKTRGTAQHGTLDVSALP